jgi:hypothetical protein
MKRITMKHTNLTATSSASHLLCTRNGTLVLTYNPGPDPLRFPLIMRTSRDEGVTWTQPTLIAIWAQIKDSPDELHGEIHSARIALKK